MGRGGMLAARSKGVAYCVGQEGLGFKVGVGQCSRGERGGVEKFRLTKPASPGWVTPSSMSGHRRKSIFPFPSLRALRVFA